MRRSLAFVSLVFVAGAAHAEPARDVAFYLANPKERAAKVAQCNNDPGRLARTANCINAARAASRAIMNPANRGMGTIGPAASAPKSASGAIYRGKTY